VDKDGRVRALYDVHGGMEKLTIIRKILLALTVPVLPSHASLDARQARGDSYETEREGMHGLRGGLTTHGPIPTPIHS
jgi:hypothetical protein